MKKIFGVIVLGVYILGAAASAMAAEPYRVGAVFAITGPAAWLGEPERNTVKMIEAQVNAQAGERLPVKPRGFSPW